MYPAYFNLRIAHALPECFVRASLLDKLNRAAKMLPNGISLVILDGWRPFSVQEYLFETLVNLMKKAQPQYTDEQYLEHARTLVSPPSDNPLNPSPHLTGGAVDVTLCDSNGRFLNMGTAFDEAHDNSWTSTLERLVEQGSSHLTQSRNNRRILHHVMSEVGFSNLPSEWWHFDYGNQLWAYNTGASQAIYGAVTVGGIEQLWKHQLNSKDSFEI